MSVNGRSFLLGVAAGVVAYHIYVNRTGQGT